MTDQLQQQLGRPDGAAGRCQRLSCGRNNTISLRETGTMTSGGALSHNITFAISSLGTAVCVDGTPINTDANLQFSTFRHTPTRHLAASREVGLAYRNITNKGVDMHAR